MSKRRDDSTLDEKTHEAKFHKVIVALFKITKTIKQNGTSTTVFPNAAVALDAQPGMVSTPALLAVMAQDLARRNEEEPRQTYQTTRATRTRRRATKYPVSSAPI